MIDPLQLPQQVSIDIYHSKFYETIRLHLTYATEWLHTAVRRYETRYFPSHSRPDQADDHCFDRVALTECEVVTQEQRGREIYYRLEIEKMKEIDKWMQQYRKIWESRFEQLDVLLAEMKQQDKQERMK